MWKAWEPVDHGRNDWNGVDVTSIERRVRASAARSLVPIVGLSPATALNYQRCRGGQQTIFIFDRPDSKYGQERFSHDANGPIVPIKLHNYASCVHAAAISPLTAYDTASQINTATDTGHKHTH